MLWLWLMWVQSMQGAKAPVIRETWLPVQGTEAVKLPLDPSLQEGKYIESVISLSQASLPPPFLMLSSSLSFHHAMAYEQFLPLLLFIYLERDFNLRLISV